MSIATEDVLNRSLHARLLRHFGAVRVSRRGEVRFAYWARDLRQEGDARKLVVSQHGEQYHVCCPWCGDRDFQLTVNHRHGQRDEDGHLLFLAYCHHRNCLARPEHRAALAELLGATDGSLERARIGPGRFLTPEERKPRLPGSLTRLDGLPRRHHARRYLLALGLDPERVGRFYGVHHCAEDDALTRDRLIIPIRENGQLRGWQALAVRHWEPDAPPQYVSAPELVTSNFVYNLDQARQYETGVLVRRSLDVWSFGPMALCPPGRPLSERQQRQLLRAFREHTLVVMLDAEDMARPGVRRFLDDLRWPLRGLFAVVPPPSRLPCGPERRSYLREYVKEQAAEQGVRVRYQKRE